VWGNSPVSSPFTRVRIYTETNHPPLQPTMPSNVCKQPLLLTNATPHYSPLYLPHTQATPTAPVTPFNHLQECRPAASTQAETSQTIDRPFPPEQQTTCARSTHSTIHSFTASPILPITACPRNNRMGTELQHAWSHKYKTPLQENPIKDASNHTHNHYKPASPSTIGCFACWHC